ncbi:MAG: bacteriohemerythrin [Colwellia sp.]
MSKRFLLQAILGLTFVFIIGLLLYSKIEYQIKMSVRDSLKSSLNITEQALTSVFLENNHTVTAYASSPSIIRLTKELLLLEPSQQVLINSPAQQKIRALLVPLLKAHDFRGFFIISPDNISLASTRDVNTGIENPLTHQPKLLKKVWTGQTAVSLPQASDVPLRNEKGQLIDHYATMYSAAPIKDKNNNIIAILTLRADPFAHFTKVLQRGRVGETGETYAFNSQGTLISNSRFDQQLIDMKLLKINNPSILNIPIRVPDPISHYENLNNLPLTFMANSALNGESGYNGDGYLDYRGINVIGSWTWNKELNLGLATEQDFDEAYLSLYTSRYIFILFCIIITFTFTLWLMGSNRNRKILLKEISIRKQAELEYQKISVAIDQNPIPIIITNTSGVINYINKAFTKKTGYSLEESLGENPKFLQSGQEPIEKFKQMWGQILQGKSWQGTLINKKKDGTIFTDKTTIFPVKDKNNNISCFVAIEEDITEKIKIETMLRHAQKMDAVGELAGGIAHDFNNLLGIILGNISMLQRKLQLDEKNTKRLMAIEKSANRGATLTKQLLAFTRKEAHIIKTVNINDIVIGMDALIEQSVGSGVITTINTTNHLWLTDLDPAELEDALINLCVNAGHAMEEQGEISITTSNTQHDFIDKTNNTKKEVDCVLLTISDNGSGIPNEIKSKIFEPFFTTKPRGKGTGLGLSKVFGFVKRTGGELCLYSELGIGTEFKLFFPKSINSSLSVTTSVKTEKKTITGCETILIVDDEQELANIAQCYLNEAGFKTHIAHSGEQALTLLKNNALTIDLVLSDIVMPGEINGFALANEVLKNWSDIRITLMSGFTSNAERSVSQSKHISRHLSRSILQKPYSEQALLHHVRTTLDEKFHLPWLDKFAIGIESIDKDHKVLIFLVNRIYADNLVNAPTDEFLYVLQDLLNYSQYHFKREKVVLEACNFPEFEQHCQIHNELISQLKEFIAQVKLGLSSDEKNKVLKLVLHWLFEHLEGADKTIQRYTDGKEDLINSALNKLE